MKVDILTIFPDFFRGPLDFGIVRRAREVGLGDVEIHDLRAFAHDRHRTVDDRPFGGGEGMVLKPEPIFECLEALKVRSWEDRIAGGTEQSVVLLSAHYTGLGDFRGMTVPEVLVSGNHEDTGGWRRRTALEKTGRNRPDLLQQIVLSDEDKELLAQIRGKDI